MIYAIIVFDDSGGIKMKAMIINTAAAYDSCLRILQLIRQAYKKAPSVIPEDVAYKWSFINKYMPALYEQHTRELYSNCVFCSNLVRSDCHKYCLKCSSGTYIHCAPALPTIISESTVYQNTSTEKIVRPWFYRETCSKFSRLPKSKYFKNLYSPLSAISIYNYEALEGLEQGLLSGKRPCHICASLDYEIYRACLMQEDFNVTSKCTKISSAINSFYQDKPSS
jgi:hypothetical protein